MKEQPVKLGLIGIGVLAAASAIIYDKFFKPVAPTGIEDVTGILLQLASVASFLMSAFADIKKALPPEAIQFIKDTISSGGKINISQLIEAYGKVDMAAVMAVIKRFFPGKEITIKGDEIAVDPPKPVDPGPVPVIRPMTDDECVRAIVDTASRISRSVKLNLTVAGKPAIIFEVATTEPTA